MTVSKKDTLEQIFLDTYKEKYFYTKVQRENFWKRIKPIILKWLTKRRQQIIDNEPYPETQEISDLIEEIQYECS